MTDIKWGFGDLLIIVDLLLLALGFILKNNILIAVGLIIGFTLLGLHLFLYPKMKREMLDRDRNDWGDLK